MIKFPNNWKVAYKKAHKSAMRVALNGEIAERSYYEGVKEGLEQSIRMQFSKDQVDQWISEVMAEVKREKRAN